MTSKGGRRSPRPVNRARMRGCTGAGSCLAVARASGSRAERDERDHRSRRGARRTRPRALPGRPGVPHQPSDATTPDRGFPACASGPLEPSPLDPDGPWRHPGARPAHGGVAERPIAAVLKTAVPQGTEGSNPSASASSRPGREVAREALPGRAPVPRSGSVDLRWMDRAPRPNRDQGRLFCRGTRRRRFGSPPRPLERWRPSAGSWSAPCPSDRGSERSGAGSG